MATYLRIASILFLAMLNSSIVHTFVKLDHLVMNVLHDTMSVLEEERFSKRSEQTTVVVDTTSYLALQTSKTENKPSELRSEIAPTFSMMEDIGLRGSSSEAVDPFRNSSDSSDKPVMASISKLSNDSYSSRKSISTSTSTMVNMRSTKNKNLQVTHQIHRGILEAAAMTRVQSETRLQDQVVQACNSRAFIFARKMLGHSLYSALYNAGKKDKTKRRSGRRAVSSVRKVFTSIKKKIGNEKFDKLMAVDGAVTLSIAMDTTGSMEDEIKAATSLAVGIVNTPRPIGQEVDYILFPFNDLVSNPELHGPYHHMDATKKLEFIKLLSGLKAEKGGDCDESTVDGMHNALNNIQLDSPMYLFTDAGAKDASNIHIEALLEMSDMSQTSINFFLSDEACLFNSAVELYKSIAVNTGGQVLYFSKATGISGMTVFVNEAFRGGIDIPAFKNRRKRRNVGQSEYVFQVDDSVDTLSTAVVSKGKGDIYLYQPDGTLQLKGKTNTGQGSLYMISKPRAGGWTLRLDESNRLGDQIITVRGISDENIDFQYYFALKVKLYRKMKTVTTSSPIKGKEVTVVVTVPAYAKTQPSSFQIHVTNKDHEMLKSVSLRQYKRPGMYIGKFRTPSHDFKMILKGKTKNGMEFKRLGRGTVRPQNAVIHVLIAPRGFILSSSGRSATIIVFALHILGDSEYFEIKTIESKKYAYRVPKRIIGIQGRTSMFTVSFKVTGDAKKGSTHNVVVFAVGKKSGARIGLPLQLLIQ